MKHETKRSTLKYEALLLIAILFWSSSFALTKPLLGRWGVFQFMSFRFALGGSILTGILLIIKRFRPTRRSLIGGIVTGVLLFLAFILHTYGLSMTTVAKNAFLVGSTFIFVPFIVTIGNKKSQPVQVWLSAAIALIGLALLTLDGVQGGVNAGDFLTLAGTVLVALYIVKVEKYMRDCDALTFTSFQLTTVGILALAAMPFIDRQAVDFRTADIVPLAILVLGCTVLAYLLANYSQRFIPATRMSLLYVFEPVFGAVLAQILLSEAIGLQGLIGIGLIVFIAVRPNLPRRD